jgi:hypothetical protein
MSETELLIKEIQTLPADYVTEVMNFIDLLKQGGSARKSYSGLPVYSAEKALRVSAERAAVRRANPALNTMGKYKGCLKGSPNFDREGMDIQRELRNEWE